jgi:hypothetical protein
MTNVIDINKAKAERDAPDADCVISDGNGGQLYLYAIDYRLDGREFTATIAARSFPEAERHARAMRKSASVAGWIKARGRM